MRIWQLMAERNAKSPAEDREIGGLCSQLFSMLAAIRGLIPRGQRCWIACLAILPQPSIEQRCGLGLQISAWLPAWPLSNQAASVLERLAQKTNSDRPVPLLTCASIRQL